MLHPKTKLKYISKSKGYGIFATELISKGTVTFVQDPLDIVINPSNLGDYPDNIRPVIEKFSYIDHQGNHIISWDHAKYMNHCCQANTLTTGYGFEIAIADILPGEEITDDYGLFTIEHNMKISCKKLNCRNRVSIVDFEKNVDNWDKKIISAFKNFNQVEQPLLPFIGEDITTRLQNYISTGDGYCSVASQRYLSEELKEIQHFIPNSM